MEKSPALLKAYNKLESMARTAKNKKTKRLFQRLADDIFRGAEQYEEIIADIETENASLMADLKHSGVADWEEWANGYLAEHPEEDAA